MLSTKSIKQRIRSVRNIGQITKAMEVVSATKMRKSQEFALQARPYAVASLEMLQNLLLRTPQKLMPPLLKSRPVKNTLLLVVTSDKGLAGALNANVLRKAESLIHPPTNLASGSGASTARGEADFVSNHGTGTVSARVGGGVNADIHADQRGMNRLTVTVGKKAKDYFERRGIAIYKSFSGFGDYSTLQETLPVANLILEGFLDGEWDEIEAVYMNFRTTLIQEVAVKKILPATRESLEEAVAGILPERGRYVQTQTGADFTQTNAEKVSVSQRQSQRESAYRYEYKFEPSPAEILAMLVSQLLRMHMHHIILESNASEHSARMVAMKNASDNARELIGGLTLAYNKARQAGITNELIEITAGREALEA